VRNAAAHRLLEELYWSATPAFRLPLGMFLAGKLLAARTAQSSTFLRGLKMCHLVLVLL
jgi:hypothetical protein